MNDLAGMGIDTTGWDLGGYSGDPQAGSSAGVPVPVYSGEMMPGDIADNQAMAPWNPAPAQQQGVPWWAGIAAYGITKAIDNQFHGSPTGLTGNTYPGGGSNAVGKSYTLRPTGAGGQAVRAGISSPLGKMAITANPMMLAAVLAVLYVLFK